MTWPAAWRGVNTARSSVCLGEGVGGVGRGPGLPVPLVSAHPSLPFASEPQSDSQENAVLDVRPLPAVPRLSILVSAKEQTFGGPEPGGGRGRQSWQQHASLAKLHITNLRYASPVRHCWELQPEPLPFRVCPSPRLPCAPLSLIPYRSRPRAGVCVFRGTRESTQLTTFFSEVSIIHNGKSAFFVLVLLLLLFCVFGGG